MARQGIEVTYMMLTNGDKGNHNPEITRNQLVAMRMIRTAQCCRALWYQGSPLYGRGRRLLAPHALDPQACDA